MLVDPKRRLGCGRSGVREVKHHKWFELDSFDWRKLQQMEMESFYEPKVPNLDNVAQIPYNDVQSALLLTKPCPEVLWGSFITC